MMSQNDLSTLNPWAASPTPSPSEDVPAVSTTINDDEHEHEHEHEERDAWRRRSSTITVGSSNEGSDDFNSSLAPQTLPNSSAQSQSTAAMTVQDTMNFDEFDPFRPDKNDSTDTVSSFTTTTADSSNAKEQHTSSSTGDDGTAALVYSETTPPPTPSKKKAERTSTTSAAQTNEERHVGASDSDVGQSGPRYTLSSSTSTAQQEATTNRNPNQASSSSTTGTSTSTPTSTSTNMKQSTSSSGISALSNPLATIASAFRKRDFSNNSSNAPSRSNTPMPQGQSTSSSTSAGTKTQAKGGQSNNEEKKQNAPMGKPAPVVLIRDNDDHILGEESGSSSIAAGASSSSNAKTVKGASASSNSAAASAAAAVIQQAAGTESAGIIGEEHPSTTSNNSKNEGGEDDNGGASSYQNAFDFNFFLDQMRNKSAEPIAKYLRSFLREFNKKMWNVNDQIRVINDFLDFIAIKMRENEIWRNDSEKEFDNAVEGMEKLVMNRVFHLTFVPALEPAQQATTQTDDLERDHVLSQRIKLFQWVSEEHLDLPEHKDTASFVEFAKQEMRKINMYKAPRDKLICILNSCKVIFGLMRHLNLEDGADTFIPFLILVVLRANPDHLISNVQYIQRFRNPDRLAGENGYYLSSLNAAISFIETMDGSSLSNITQEQFELNVEEAIRALPSDDEQQALPPAQKEKDNTQTQPAQGSSRAQASQSVPTSPTKPMNEKRASYQAEASLHAVQQGPPRSQSPAEATRDFFIRSSDNLQKTVSKPLQALGKIFTEMGSESEMIAGYPGPGHQQLSGTQGQAGQLHRQQQPLSPHLGQQQHPPTPRGQRPPSLRSRSTASLASPLSPQARSHRLPPLPAGAQGHYEPGYIPNAQGQPPRPGSAQNRGSSYQAADFLDDSVPAEEVQATADKNYQATFNAKIDTLLNIFPGIERETLEIVLLSNGEDVERTIEGLLDMQ